MRKRGEAEEGKKGNKIDKEKGGKEVNKKKRIRSKLECMEAMKQELCLCYS